MVTLSNDIIILGAGPSGLMFANQLSRFGIDYIILDAKPGPTDQSRALVVHSRSLEIYEQLGISDEVVANGQASNGINLYKKGKMVASVKLVNDDEKASPFPFLMMYEQSKNETLLYHHLLAQKKDVKWDTNIRNISQTNEGYTLTGLQNNEDISLQCKYLIACDGSKSLVREFAQMPFEGGSYLNVFFVADTHTDAGFSSEKLSLFLSKRTISMFFPIKGHNHFRALGILPKSYYHKDEIPFEDILDEVKRELAMPVNFYDTGWHSTYKLHHKKVARFSKDNLFFVGDAAHVHSPAGGQGMNTGLQDAYNLAWKLALVQNGKAAPALLNSYHEERNPVANELLKSTDNMFQAMTTDNFLFGIFRMYFVPIFVPLITKSKAVRKLLFHSVSQINIHYKSSSLSKGKAGKVEGGMRLPFFNVMQEGASISIYKLIKDKAEKPFSILVYNLPDFDASRVDNSMFNTITIQPNDSNNKAFSEAHLPTACMIVVRPDNYIAYIDTSANMVECNDFMRMAYGLM